jgi:PKD repeat protein
VPVPGSPTSRGRRRGPAALLVAILLATIVPALPASPGPKTVDAATKVAAGYRDHQYGDPAAPGGDDVTAGRNQSKLWTRDGRWFGLLFDNRTTPNARFRIWRFDMATQDWTNTNVGVDDRNRSHADVLASNNDLWVVSGRAESAGSTNRDVRVYKYQYDTTAKAYTAVAGYPKIIAGTASGTGYPTIAADSGGRLWVAYPQAGRIRITTSGDGGSTWAAPFDLPGMGGNVTSQDVAAIAPLGLGGTTGIGVLWSNSSVADDAFYFAAHVTGQPVGTWMPREAAPLASPGTFTYTADGHISLKTDPSGALIAAVKTGRNDDPAPNGGDPLVVVFRRTGSPAAAGTWTSHTVTTVTIEGTRPVLVLDPIAGQANVFLTHPDDFAEGAQSIYRRTAPLNTLDFGTPSLGTPFISSVTETAINDATSSKQLVGATTGLLVAAADIPSLRYLHNCAGGPCPVAPVAAFTGTPTTGLRPLTVNFTDQSSNAPNSWSWSFGDGGTSTSRNPSHQYTAAGTYTVTLTAANVAGSDAETKTAYVKVNNPPPPVAAFTANKTSGTAPLTVTFTDQSTNNPTSWSWTFGDGGTSTSRNPTHQYADPGTYTVKLTATNNGGSDAETKTGYITVNEPPQAQYFTLSPRRVLDTRKPTGLSGTFKSGVPRTLSIAGANGIPGDALAITGNLTVVGQTRAGFLSIGPSPVADPTTSNLNFPVGDARANGVTVPLNTSGDLSITYKGQGGGSTHVVLDVTGYFRATTGGATFFQLSPKRALDTRNGTGGIGGVFRANVPKTLSVAGANTIPGNATAVTGNLTVVSQTKSGYLSITPSPTASPTTSTLNFPSGDIRANGVTVPLNASGDLSIVYKATSGATTHVVLDITGYFVPGSSGATFVPIPPARILDTRTGNGLPGQFIANTPRAWLVNGRRGIASDAVAIVGNVTVVSQTKKGYVSLTPTATSTPTTSTLNFPLGDTRANNFTLRVPTTDTIAGVYKAAAGAKTHLVVDVTGYYE